MAHPREEAPPCEQNSWHTPMKILPCPKLHLWVVINKQGMLFSIVPRFGNTWFLLRLEWLDADWLNGCVCLEALHSDCFYCMWYLLCLEILHSDCFCCMWYCYHAYSLDECPSSPAGGRIFCCPCILIGWVVWRRKRHPLLKWPQIVL